MFREGINGDFLACPRFPACRYTESFKNFEDLVWRDKKGGCKTCKFTGLLPFTRKDGSIAHDVFYDCSCKEAGLIERYQPLKPCEYDFPMSSDFRDFSFDYCGYPLQETVQGLDLEDRLNDLEAEVSKPGSIPRIYTNEINLLKAQILNLQRKAQLHASTTSKKDPQRKRFKKYA